MLTAAKAVILRTFRVKTQLISVMCRHHVPRLAITSCGVAGTAGHFKRVVGYKRLCKLRSARCPDIVAVKIELHRTESVR